MKFYFALATLMLACAFLDGAKNAGYAANNPIKVECPSSYNAVYTPQGLENSDHHEYELTFDRIKQPDGDAIPLFVNVKVQRKDAEGNPWYEINFNYSCGGGSSPACSMTAGTQQGKPIELIPASLNIDFSETRFISNNNARAPVPYAIILPGVSQQLYYAGNRLDKKTLKVYSEEKPLISSLPEVWIISSCKD